MTQARLADSWNGINEIVLYGLGMVSQRFIKKLTADFEVPFIIDRKKKGMVYQGIPVISYEEAVARLKKEKKKTVVITSRKVYAVIREQLEKDGLAEYQDFCWVEQFAVEWYWTSREQVNIAQVNTAVTTYCTLNCAKCNMFMPYYKVRRHYLFEEIKTDIDLLMEHIDYVFQYVFLGGEPFLNPDLHRMIEYAGKTYHDRVGGLSITTNATLVPDGKTLDILKRYQVHVVISDYTEAAGGGMEISFKSL